MLETATDFAESNSFADLITPASLPPYITSTPKVKPVAKTLTAKAAVKTIAILTALKILSCSYINFLMPLNKGFILSYKLLYILL